MKLVLVLVLLVSVYCGKYWIDTKYDDSNDKDNPCFSKQIYEFKENEAIIASSRYQINDEKTWIYYDNGEHGMGLDENEKVYSCNTEK